MRRGIDYYCELFDAKSGAAASNCVSFGGGGELTSGGVKRVAGWSGVD